MEPTTYGWLVLAFPLAGSLLIAFGFRALPGRSAGWIGTAAIGLSFLASLGMLVQLLDLPVEERQLTNSLYDYASAGGLDIQMNVLVDPLSVYMCLIVSGISTMIHLYSISYVTTDRGFNRFFSYLNFFVFSMLLLVLAGNIVLLIVGWAFVGFASYALISFWYRRTTATEAGMKAFVINVVGDIGLVLAALFLFRELGTFDLLGIFEAAPEEFTTNEGVVVLIGLLLLVGAFAKSAQVPLHTWLPDAMEGPTPVSALIHAATMVTAGVYLIGRFHPIFEIALTAADVAAIIGLVTLLIAATIALVVTDLKRIIAYSTMSQIGYMVMGVGIGAYSRRLLPPADPRLLQGAAVHGGRLGDRGDGEPPEHRPDGRLPQVAAVHLRAAADRLPGAGGFPRHLGLLLQGRDPRLRRVPRRLLLGVRDRRLHRRPDDRDLRLPDRLPGRVRRALRAVARDLEQGDPRSPRAAEPGHRRARGHRRRLPGREAQRRRGQLADEDRDVGARRRRPVRRRSSRSRASTR